MAKKDQEYTFTGQLSPDFLSLVIDNGQRLTRILKNFEGDVLEITIKKHYRQRSIAQNNWIWGVCIPTIRAWMKENEGEAPDKEFIYAMLRQKYAGSALESRTIDGEEYFYLTGKRFSQMTTVEFSDIVEIIVLAYAEKGLEILLPIAKTNNLTTDFLKDE